MDAQIAKLFEGLKIPWLLQLCGFKSRFEYSDIIPCRSMIYKGFLFIKLETPDYFYRIVCI